MRSLSSTVLPSLLCLTTAASALAEPIVTAASPPAPAFDVGARVGGWGYHREGDAAIGAGWTAGRMNGVGVFGSRSLRGPAFVELGLDLYATADAPLGPDAGDVPADRMSGLVSAAIGARMPLTSWMRGFVQVGAGLEVTPISVPYGDQWIRDSRVFPDGFLGAGLDLRIARGTYLGAAFRMLAMGTFTYDRQRLDMSAGWVTAPTADQVFDAGPGLAAQGQFFLRREL